MDSNTLVLGILGDRSLALRVLHALADWNVVGVTVSCAPHRSPVVTVPIANLCKHSLALIEGWEGDILTAVNVHV